MVSRRPVKVPVVPCESVNVPCVSRHFAPLVTMVATPREVYVPIFACEVNVCPETVPRPETLRCL